MLKEVLSIEKQINKLERKLVKAKESAYKDLWKDILKNKFLGRINWKLDSSANNYLSVYSYVSKDTNPELQDLLKRIAKVYIVSHHCSFEVEKGITLRMDDGEVRLYNFTTNGIERIVSTPEHYINFLIKHNVKVDHSSLDSELEKIKEKQNNINYILKMYDKVLA